MFYLKVKILCSIKNIFNKLLLIYILFKKVLFEYILYYYRNLNIKMEDSIDKEDKEVLEKANKIWENELKDDFNTYINKCLMEALNSLKNNLREYDSSIKSYIKELDKKFEENFNAKVSELQKYQKDNMKNNINITEKRQDNV